MKHRKSAVSWCVVALVVCVLGMVPHDAAASGATGYLTKNDARIEFMYAYATVEPNPYDDTQKNVVVFLTDYPLSDEAVTDEWTRKELVEEKWIRYIKIDIASNESGQWVQMLGMWFDPSGSSYSGMNGLGTLELKVFDETQVEGRYYTDGEEKGVAFDMTFQGEIRRAGDAPHSPESSEAETGTDSAERVKAYMNRGEAAINARKADPAIEALTKAIELDPAYADAYLYRGYVYGAIEQYEPAIADYTKIIELTPEDASIYNRRGALYDKMELSEQAIADYTKAIELDPAYARAYFNRGYSYEVMGEFDRAIADYTKALEVEPDEAYIYTCRGRVYAETEQYELALADYGKAIELKPDDVDTYYYRAETFFKMGECDEARQDFRQIDRLGYVAVPELVLAVEKQCPTYVFELDTPQHADDPEGNVVKTSLESDGANLVVTLTLKEDIASYQERHSGVGSVLYIHIDTDNNRDTGGVMAHSGYDSGFEYFITLSSCLKQKNLTHCTGSSMNWADEDLFEEPVVTFFSSYDVYRYTSYDDTTEEAHESSWESPREDIAGNIVKAVIPYTEIGAAPGQVIRIVTDERYAENAQSPDILLTLK